jgi:hypothetical protein
VRERGSNKGIALKKAMLLTAIMLSVSGGSLLLGADRIALLVSERTDAYFQSTYGQSACEMYSWWLERGDEYKRYYLGWKDVLDNAGMNYEIIYDDGTNPLNLEGIKVLILSNSFWLDDGRTKLISEWVRKGGRLLATFGSGYAGMEGDFLKGGTNGLHELWGDPSHRLNSSFYHGNPFVKVQITGTGGPTGVLNPGLVLDYQFMANILIQRPDSSTDAVFIFNDLPSGRPAILSRRHAKGTVVYYAFAPEYLIALANDVAGHCPNDTRYPASYTRAVIWDIAAGLRPLMVSTLKYLLNQ